MHQKTVGMFLTVLLLLMEEEATIADDHDDDVIDANAIGDEYTDHPGVHRHKTTQC